MAIIKGVLHEVPLCRCICFWENFLFTQRGGSEAGDLLPGRNEQTRCRALPLWAGVGAATEPDRHLALDLRCCPL